MISPEDRKAFRNDILAGTFFLLFLVALFAGGLMLADALG